MADRFTNFLPFIFEWECVYDRKGNVIAENVEDDGGKWTKFGVDQSGHPELTAKQIKELTKEQATEIYRKEWQKWGCERYPTL
jgi:lysozyme family protein